MRYAVFRCTVLKEHGVQNEMETGEASKGVGKKQTNKAITKSMKNIFRT